MYEAKLNIVQNEMNRMDIDILGISETKWIGSGHFRNANNTLMYWGHSDVLGAQRYTGGTRPTERMTWE
jgi:hypothetical protein